jgi:ABC-type transporter Mla maintaining outer membrane lipid asymmetry ATPase subunit MlaF
MDDVAVGSMQDIHEVVAEGINWTVRSGDYWVIAGLQGSGKSDLLMMAGGLMAPLRGSYKFLGEPMPIFEEGRLRLRLRLGLVFDGGQLFHHLTVRENVSLPLRYHQNLSKAEAEADVWQMLEAAELTNWADSTPGALGRHWQKRVGLARALMLQPELLLVDNPLAGLDGRHLSWWLSFLTQLSQGHNLMKNRPITLVVTSSDLRPWRQRARQFAVLKNQQFQVLNSTTHLDHESELLAALD